MQRDRYPPLYPILDSSFLTGASDRAAFLRGLVRELAEAQVELLQYRNKQGNPAEILADARVMREAAGGRMRLIMNDRPELAVEAGFDGVHVGQTDMSAAAVRAIVGSAKIVGVSTHDEEQLRAADAERVDYIAIGPVYPTATKETPDPVVGLEGVRMARSVTKKPLVAIGGITAANAAAVWEAGADSVAVISAIFRRGIDAPEAVREFLRLLR